MENNLTVKGVSYQKGVIKFDSFETYKAQAQDVADYINGLELTEENYSLVKKDLADARKVVKGLDDARKQLKKEMLEPYQAFEKQIKELQSIIDKADKQLREQVKAMDDKAREAKRDDIRVVFDKRVHLYPNIKNILENPFDAFLKPQHLNKTMTLNKVEKEMVKWLEDIEKELTVLLNMDDENAIKFYLTNGYDFARAIEQAKEFAEQKVAKEEELHEDEFVTVTISKNDLGAVIQLLTNNKIDFKL